MAWSILYPEGYPIDGRIVPPNYGRPESGPKVGHGIGWMRAKNKRIAWKAQYERNRKMRAALEAEMKGETGSKRAAEYHSRLSALSFGSA